MRFNDELLGNVLLACRNVLICFDALLRPLASRAADERLFRKAA